jgi:hypothetical protein
VVFGVNRPAKILNPAQLNKPNLNFGRGSHRVSATFSFLARFIFFAKTFFESRSNDQRTDSALSVEAEET